MSLSGGLSDDLSLSGGLSDDQSLSDGLSGVFRVTCHRISINATAHHHGRMQHSIWCNRSVVLVAVALSNHSNDHSVGTVLGLA